MNNALATPVTGPSASPSASIGIIALSQIPDDPRVRRQGDAFSSAGWAVVGIGLAGAKSALPSWPVLDENDLAPIPVCVSPALGASPPAQPILIPPPREKFLLDGLTLPRKLLKLVLNPGELYFAVRKRIFDAGKRLGLKKPRLKGPSVSRLCKVVAQSSGFRWVMQRGVQVQRHGTHRIGQVRYVMRMQAPRFWPPAVEKTFWRLNSRFNDLYRLGGGHKPDIWLANDWTALPIARRLARENGGILVYDTHELAADEYTERLLWQLLHRPVTVAVEKECLKEAALVTCVSDGIADRLQELYGLKERPLVIRNTPSYQEMPFRPTGERIEVLYHGIVAPGRGLEECIRSVAEWRPEFALTIRGPSSESYKAQLEEAIRGAGVEGRVTLVPPVPMVDLVRAANVFDVGLFALPDHSRHNRFALPNKFFEYTMAGLALCVSDLPEMARLVKDHDLGILFSGMEPAAIAAAINSLDRTSIDRYKRLSLEAAQQLNWQKESEKLVSLCSRLVEANRKT